jgi:hypothetical protein
MFFAPCGTFLIFFQKDLYQLARVALGMITGQDIPELRDDLEEFLDEWGQMFSEDLLDFVGDCLSSDKECIGIFFICFRNFFRDF